MDEHSCEWTPMVLAFVILNDLEMNSKWTISQLEVNYKLTS
jgi:hypothetical protein